jgi:hypothetical protein
MEELFIVQIWLHMPRNSICAVESGSFEIDRDLSKITLFIRELSYKTSQTFTSGLCDNMITEYVANLALMAGVKLSEISVVEGKDVGCLDSYLVHISTNEKRVSALLYQHDLDNLQFGRPCDRLNLRVSRALTRLKMPQET